MNNKLFGCLFFTVITLNIYAVGKVNYSFRHLDTEKGLSQNSVLSILQDKKGFMWFGTKDGLNRYDGNTIKIFKNDIDNPYSLGNNTVWSLLERSNGDIWVGTERGVYIFDPETERFTFFDQQTSTGEVINHWVTGIDADKNGNIWIAAGHLFCYVVETGELKIDRISRSQAWNVKVDNNDVWVSTFGGVHRYGVKDYNLGEQAQQIYCSTSNNELVSVVTPFNSNHLLIGTLNEGLKIMDKQTEEITSYHLEKSFGDENLYIRDLKQFSDGNIWIGTQTGLYIHDPVSNKTTYLYHNWNDNNSLSDNAIYSMYEDREGGIWIGTYFGGVCYYPKGYTYFKKDYPISNVNSIIGERVSGICEDKNNNIWIGTEDAGLCRLDPITYHFEHFKPDETSGLNYGNVHDVISDDDLLWIGTFSHGINVYNLKNKSWKYYRPSSEPGSIDNEDIFALYKDHSGRIWVGTSSSAFLYDREADNFIRLNELLHHFVSDIIEDRHGNIWFATYSNGVYCYNPETEKYTNYTYDKNDPGSISHYKIICMFVDSKQRLWFATESRGICMFDEKNGKFTRYGTKDGLSNDVIYKILEDDESNLWLSSNVGLMRFNPATGEIRLFTLNNGLTSNQFNYKSGYKNKKGIMYFGTVKGMISFKPSEFNKNEYIPPVVITGFKLLNSEKSFEKQLSNNEPVVLTHKQSSFHINFAALSYVDPDMNEYMYKMEGLDEGWNHLQKAREITYSNLSHGKYIFKVKGSNNDGIWNEKVDTLAIIIHPPFWFSTWAYVFYCSLIIMLLFVFLWYYKQRLDQKNLRKRILFETQKEKEIYHAKIDFFTNVAHEVRTPLTLIKGPLEYILTNKTDQEECQANLLTMKKNTDRLLSLINQLLDFRTTEAHGFSLSFTQEDICDVLDSVYVMFKPMAEQRNIRITIKECSTPILADIDREAVTKIISNLFTNAIKYGDTRIEVELAEFQDNSFSLRINNDGQLIPAKLRKKIFEPFYQANKERSGSGIGLALVRSLVDLHKGKVYVDDTFNDVNSFVVILPKKQDNVILLKDQGKGIEGIEVKTESIEARKHEKEHAKQTNELTLLIVEDNEELLQFVTEKLGKYYTIFTAKNGLEALEVLEQEVINIIVSDVMMPQMDGFELCEKVKENQEFSHIPVILLTAKTNIQNKIEGLELGADAYIEKPFSMEYLQARIDNLFDNRRKLRESFANSPFMHTGSIAATKADEQFLSRLTDIIEKNMANPDFNVDRLAEYMFMSRSSLLRKIKGIAEIAPNDFIKLIRLKKAAEILQDGVYKVNEVCFLVGFSSTSYFSKVFHKQFGVLPKDFMKGERKTGSIN